MMSNFAGTYRHIALLGLIGKLILLGMVVSTSSAHANIAPTGQDILRAQYDLRDREELLTEERLREEYSYSEEDGFTRETRWHRSGSPEMFTDTKSPEQFSCQPVNSLMLCRFLNVSRRGSPGTLKEANQEMSDIPYSTQRRSIVLEFDEGVWRVPHQYVLPLSDGSVEMKLKDRECYRIRAVTGNPNEAIYVHRIGCGHYDAEVEYFLTVEDFEQSRAEYGFFPQEVVCIDWENQPHVSEDRIGQMARPERLRALGGVDLIEGFELYEQCIK